jgi:hypothetical protein
MIPLDLVLALKSEGTGGKSSINSQVHSTSEHTSAETTDGSGRNFRKVDGTDNASLSNTKTGNEATSIDGIHVAIVSNKDGDAEDPETAELASSPNTADTITNDESTDIRP